MSIRDTLAQIESKARWVRDDALGLSVYVRRLPARRSFETNAQAMLVEAEQELVTALERVRAAKTEYAAKPVNDKAA